MVHDDCIPILDFGSQYAQLIARRVREKGVYSILVRPDIAVDELKQMKPRGVILSRGSTLEIPLTELKRATRMTPQINSSTTLESVERDHILRVLSETRWVIGGPAGAAARLGMNRTTLNHRMRKLGISRPQPQHS